MYTGTVVAPIDEELILWMAKRDLAALSDRTHRPSEILVLDYRSLRDVEPYFSELCDCEEHWEVEGPVGQIQSSFATFLEAAKRADMHRGERVVLILTPMTIEVPLKRLTTFEHLASRRYRT